MIPEEIARRLNKFVGEVLDDPERRDKLLALLEDEGFLVKKEAEGKEVTEL